MEWQKVWDGSYILNINDEECYQFDIKGTTPAIVRAKKSYNTMRRVVCTPLEMIKMGTKQPTRQQAQSRGWTMRRDFLNELQGIKLEQAPRHVTPKQSLQKSVERFKKKFPDERKVIAVLEGVLNEMD